MQIRLKQLVFFWGVLATPTVTVCELSPLTVPYCAMRSQAARIYREIIGIADAYTSCCDVDTFVTAATVEYHHSFNTDIVTESFFAQDYICASLEPVLTISGSQRFDRSQKFDWLADYFGLSPNFQSMITFEPEFDDIVVDWFSYYGMNRCLPGLFAMLEIPWVRNRRKISFCEQPVISGTLGYFDGYFTAQEVPVQQLNQSANSFFVNQEVPELGQDVVFEPLKFGRISPEFQTASGATELNLALGYNFLRDPDYHFGLMLRVRLPFGTRPTGQFLFEPIAGNGHHVAVGGGLTGHAMVWENQDCDQHLGVFVQAAFVDLLETIQYRSFDLRDKTNSRYMLAANVAQPNSDMLNTERVGRVFADGQFQSRYTPIVNLTTIKARVKGGAETEIFFMAHFVSKQWTIDFGYDFWYRSCEQLRPLDCLDNSRLANREWVIKGDGQMYGYRCDNDESVALSTSQSQADIHTGRNVQFDCPSQDDECTVNVPTTNGEIDNAELAFVPDQMTNANLPLIKEPGIGGCILVPLDQRIHTSIQPRFIQLSSLDFCGAASSSTLHTILVQVTWQNRTSRWIIPLVGLGGSITGASRDDDPFKRPNFARCGNPCSQSQCAACTNCTGQCRDCGYFEWSIWLRGALWF